MLMPRRKLIIISTISALFLLIPASSYLYLRYHVLKAKDFKPDNSKATAPFDLNPALTAKLQQLVRDASDSLYLLAVDSLHTDAAAETIDAFGIRLSVDSAAYHALLRSRQLPDDIFTGTLARLHITGVGIDDLLRHKKITAGSVLFAQPQINAWHHNWPFNAEERAVAAKKSLWQKLGLGSQGITIKEIRITDAALTDHNTTAKGTDVTRLKGISIALGDILIDSAAQYDASRAFFAKHAAISSREFSQPTPDSLYDFAVRNIAINAVQHTIVLNGISLKPRGGKALFKKRQKTAGEMYEITLPHIEATDVDWWAMLHGESFKADKAIVSGGSAYIYLNKWKPRSPSMTIENFPQQLLAEIGTPISVSKLTVSGVNIRYEELDSGLTKTGIIDFSNFTLNAHNITNIPALIARNGVMKGGASGMLMGKTLLEGSFQFWLAKAQRGKFSADIKSGSVDNAEVNPFAEPMGMVNFRTGQMQHATAHIRGNNATLNGKVSIAYTDLRITPLKKELDQEGKQKHKKITRAVANAVFVKNDNPGADGKLREPEYTLLRGQHGNFFNFAWSGIKKGLLLTIGVPVKFGM